MVKKSKKSKSKRISLRKKYKIIRKVKEHHKKKAKEAKKLGLNRKRKVDKDPGIPNDWPFKEQELRALEERRARALEELEQKKAARKERAKNRKLGFLGDEDMEKMAADASVKGAEFANRTVEEDALAAAKSHDHSERTFYKELVKVIEASDVILEVLDARDPLGSRCIDMENTIMKSDPNKRIVLLLNKIDLVPREAVEKWLKYFREELPAVAFKCNTQEQRSNLGWKSSSKTAKASNMLKTSDCLGAETLMKLLKNYTRSREIKLSITVGIVGLPNVGKSSVINSLKRSHVVNVGATPVKGILELCPQERLISVYKISSFVSVDDFLLKVAAIRGKLKKGGIVDPEAAARIVLHDWNEGKIPYYTLPPKRNQEVILDSTIVPELGKEFNVDEVYKAESSYIGSLASVEDFHHVEVAPGVPLNFDEQMLEEDVENHIADQTAEPMAQDAQEHTDRTINSTSRQNDKLYEAEGILDPRKVKAEKKKKRKAQKMSMMDADYDFKVDYHMKDADPSNKSAEEGDEESDAEYVPMPGDEEDA
ncbi:hypothetical protein HPP92_023224 [Vanilla planifolia]|uniref:CP-type G domain-containing protein n=1 Tax=Vanilla planifolia TaxID=51239 RepID=A0A835PX72_VANPL|nr:hypothetical protein HPP92_023224 [Vanilla planifolia]